MDSSSPAGSPTPEGPQRDAPPGSVGPGNAPPAHPGPADPAPAQQAPSQAYLEAAGGGAPRVGSRLDAVVSEPVGGLSAGSSPSGTPMVGGDPTGTPMVGGDPSGTGQPALRELTAADLESPPWRRVRLPLILFVATCASTLLVWALPNSHLPGARTTFVGLIENSIKFARQGHLLEYWQWVGRFADWQGAITYMSAVVGILLTHEMGHFLQTVRYRVPSSFPYCIPFPFSPIGTMGAVIAMDGRRADRRQMFDIGITGPLAGLAVATPIVWFGIKSANAIVNAPLPLGGGEYFPDPLIFRLLMRYLRPELPAHAELILNPLLMAGWVGMFITGLNMLPVSQLDGGHVAYTLFGRKADWIARLFMMVVIVFIIRQKQYEWILMTLIVLKLGILHPPTRDDRIPLGPVRWALGLLALLIPLLCFNPMMILTQGR